MDTLQFLINGKISLIVKLSKRVQKFLKENLHLDVNEDPEVQIDSNLISKAAQKFQIDKNTTNILLGLSLIHI